MKLLLQSACFVLIFLCSQSFISANNFPPGDKVYIPNVFSPNNDGSNDTFVAQFSPELVIATYELQVYDRFGNQMFVSTDPSKGWDGLYRNNEAERGIYVYFLSITCDDGTGLIPTVLKGEVMLLR